jgi:hypothetical protein
VIGRSWIVSALVAASFALALPPAMARPLVLQEEGGSGEGEAKQEGEEDASKKDEKEEWFAVVGGEVHTGTGAVIRDATVLARNGVIFQIGTDVRVPDDAKVLDASGLRVYPGMVAVLSSGLMGGSSDFQDTVDPFNMRMVLALAGGITSTGQSNTALKLKRGEIEGVVMREKYLVPLSYSTGNPSNKRSLVEKLEAASRYLREYRDWEEKKKKDKDLKEPSRRGVDSTVLSILKSEALARFDADSRTDLLEIARLAQRFGFRPVIDGCNEGWTVASELGRAGAFAVLTPRERRDKSEELVREGGTTIENAAILHRAGVQVAIVPANKGIDLGGIAGRDIMHLPIEAGFAVRGGLDEAAALQAITLVPARILGVDHRVGTIEKGKDCDLILTDGDLLHYQTFVQHAVVEGKPVYDKAQELYFAHIRPRPEKPPVAPEKRTDPGEEPAESKPADGEDVR